MITNDPIMGNQCRHVVALSGGYDSTALALRLQEVEPREYIYLCTPTGDELPEMVEHLLKMKELLQAPILPVTGALGLRAMIRKEKALPSHHRRWCTKNLKIKPYNRHIKTLAPAISYVGLRADESSRPGMRFAESAGVSLRFPLREWGWTEGDVVDYLSARGVVIPPRTDCARCYDQTLGEWWRLWSIHPEIFQTCVDDEDFITTLRGAQFTFRSPNRDTWPASLRDLRDLFEQGKIPPRTITQEDLFLSANRKAVTKSRRCRVCSL